MTKTARARYPLEFKREAVRLVEGGQRIAAADAHKGDAMALPSTIILLIRRVSSASRPLAHENSCSLCQEKLISGSRDVLNVNCPTLAKHWRCNSPALAHSEAELCALTDTTELAKRKR